jgi:Spy/CpxP family protein refolding chaperone
MKLRTLLLTALLLLAFVSVALAQNAAVAKRGPAKAIAIRMAKQLGLSKEQVQQIRDIVAKYRQDVAAEIKSGDTPEAKKAKVKELRETAGSAIMALLNADQKAKAEKMHFVQLLLEPGARMKARFMAALAKLDLSEEQKTSIKAIGQDAKAAAKAIRDDSSLDKAAKKAKLVELRKTTRAKVMAVLTPEQQAKLRQMLAGARGRLGGAKGA